MLCYVAGKGCEIEMELSVGSHFAHVSLLYKLTFVAIYFLAKELPLNYTVVYIIIIPILHKKHRKSL